MVEKRNRRKVFLGALLGAVSLLCIEAQAQVYSDADTVRSVQEKLNEAGFDCGTADGIAGSRTAEAITAWQNENQLTPSGEIDDELLASMGLSAAGAEETGSDTESMEALETAALSEEPEAQENEMEAPSDPIEDVTIEGTVIYNAHQVAVTAALSEDGQAVEYRVQNASENPVVVMLGDLVANEVTLNSGEDKPSLYWTKLNLNLVNNSFGGEFKFMDGILYVEAGGSGDMTMEIDSEFRDIFSDEKVSQLATSVGVIGLSKELLMDGTDVLEEGIFLDVSSLTEVEIPDAAETLTEVEYTFGSEEDQNAAGEAAEATEEAETSEAAEEAGEEENELGLTESEMQEIYAAVAYGIWEQYLEPNNISIEDFEWPDSSTDNSTRAWEYLHGYLLALLISYDIEENDITRARAVLNDETLKNAQLDYYSISESDLLMDITLEQLFMCFAKFMPNCDGIEDFAIYDWEKSLTENITFSDEQLSMGKTISDEINFLTE